MTPLSSVDSSDTSLSNRMDELISRQHTLLVVAQENQLKKSDQLVENEDYPSDQLVVNEDYPINSYVLYTPPDVVTSYFPSTRDLIKW